MGIKKIAFTDTVRADSGKGLTDSIITNPVQQINSLHAGTEGYIKFMRKNSQGGKEKQWHYKLHQVEEHIAEWITYDSYFSMNTFYTPKGLITNLKEIRTAFVDIDCYNKGFTSEQVEAQLKADYFGTEIPTPNMLIHSGRGLNLIWFLNPISGLAIDRWDELQRALFKKLESLGGDKKALDATRIFRVAGSVNSKSKEVVYFDILHDYRYDLEEISEEYFPGIYKKVRKPKKNLKPNRKAKEQTKPGVKYLFNDYTLYKARMDDIHTLVSLRSGNVEGCREYMLFLYRYWALVQHEDKEKARELMLELNSSFSIPLNEREAVHDTKSAERYYDSEEPFRITHERVIDWLGISPEEQTQLKTIHSVAEGLRRDRISQTERRRSKGVKERSQYEAERSSQKADRAAQLAKLLSENPEYTQQQLAKITGISQQTVSRLLRKK